MYLFRGGRGGAADEVMRGVRLRAGLGSLAGRVGGKTKSLLGRLLNCTYTSAQQGSP